MKKATGGEFLTEKKDDSILRHKGTASSIA